MIIVENTQEKNIFYTHWNSNPSIVIPIWVDFDKHPMGNELSFLYIKFENEDFIISCNHNDCIPANDLDLTSSTQTKFVWNKKGILQTELNIQNLKDIQTYKFFTTNQLYDLNDKLSGLTHFYKTLGIRDDLGKIIPIMKFGEVLREFAEEILIESKAWNEPMWIDTIMIPQLSKIEKVGLNINLDKFLTRWPEHEKWIANGKIYTEYNPYTLTSRPSNRHGGINFSALNKKDGTRECFIPSKNKFVQFDYDAYHIRIISKLIKYEIPHVSGHQWLADQYGCSYDESKGRTFRIIYGGVSDEDKQIPFFKKVDEFIHELSIKSETRGYLLTFSGRKIPLDWIDKRTPQKIFNYLLQSVETELNMETIKRLYESGYENLVLYQYDSYLFDVKQDDDITKIKLILEHFGFHVKTTFGTDYSKV